MADEEDSHVQDFHTKFTQRYPVDMQIFNTRFSEENVRREFFGVLLSATEDEQRAFAIELLPNDRTVSDPVTLPFDIGQKLGRYGREGKLQGIVNFLRLYIENPNKNSALSSSDEATLKSMRASMQPRIAAALIPENRKRGGRRRKTKKSKRRARKTRRRHK